MQASASAPIGLLTGADLRPGAPGGVRSYVMGLAEFLVAKGFLVTIFANGPAEAPPPGSQVRHVAHERKGSTLAFHRALRRWDADLSLRTHRLVHFQRPDDLWPLRLHGKLPPLVCTLHGNPMRGVRRRRGRIAGKAYRAIERRVIGAFRLLIAVDDKTADEYRAAYPSVAEHVRVIPNAVHPPVPALVATDPSPTDGLTFLYVGRLSVEKRVERLIGAIRHPDLSGSRLIVAGSGPQARYLERLAAGTKVEFLGEVPQDSLGTLYRRADALVLASEYEGLPTVALEALAHGCPVAALYGCGVERLVRDGGVCVESPATLHAGMLAAAELKRSGRRIAVPERYSWHRVGERILEAYREAVPEAFA